MHYPAHLAKLLAMQPPGAGPAPGQQYPGGGLRDTSRTVSPRTLPFSPYNAVPATILPDNGRQSRYGEPGAGPAPGQQNPGRPYGDFGEQMPRGAPMKKPSLRYAPGMYTEPERSPAPTRDVSERMPTQRAIPFDRMQMNRSY